jgi:SM-20-related protein
MNVLDFPALRATPVSTEPFAHVLVRDFVRRDVLESLVADLPALSARGSFPVEGLRLGALAKAMVAGLQGPEFRQAIAEKFGLDLADAPVMTTLRGNSGAQDGQIHTDSRAKRVTILLYLNPATAAWARQEGCLRLLRDPANLDDFAVEVPPVDGTLLVFPNGPTTWHGHKQFVGRRYVVQMNYMTTDSKARYEMRRHKVSAFFKRLRPAA